MEWLERCACAVRFGLLNEGFRRYSALGLACVTLGGSLVKEFWPLPDSYFNNKRNFLNVYFVKLSWGWTLSLLLPFIGLTNYIVTRSVPAVFRRICALLVGTIIWRPVPPPPPLSATGTVGADVPPATEYYDLTEARR